VAPHTGARIETSAAWRCRWRSAVAPHTGARIETLPTGECHFFRWSPLTQGRGSKPHGPHIARLRLQSPLTQGRGSKQLDRLARVERRRRPSHRGADRNIKALFLEVATIVAPHTGARIETCRRPRASPPSASPLTQGRGS